MIYDYKNNINSTSFAKLKKDLETPVIYKAIENQKTYISSLNCI